MLNIKETPESGGGCEAERIKAKLFGMQDVKINMQRWKMRRRRGAAPLDK